MKRLLLIISLMILTNTLLMTQTTEVYDDFEGNSNIPEWIGDNCVAEAGFANPFIDEDNNSAYVLKYEDSGGQYANVRFQMLENFDLSTNHVFSLKIYVPSNSISGEQKNQVSLKLQNGNQDQAWSDQTEIVKNIDLDTWQTVTFNFKSDSFININGGSDIPIRRDDLNRVVIQVNGEDNTDNVTAYIDDLILYEEEYEEPVFDKLVWSDEFDVNGPVDPEKWFHQTIIPNGEGWFNNEVQHYTDRIENSYVEDGILKIVAKKETFTDQGITKEYTSARLNSKFAFTYGMVEIRAKMPIGVGTWPALWMLGTNINDRGAWWETQGFATTDWPACGEIDIMEHWGDNQGYVSSALHTPSSHGATENYGGRIVPTVSSEFHIYKMVWTEERIVFSVDDFIHYTYNPQDKNDATWPFYEDQFLLFNVAIQEIIQSEFTESAMEVDYIRVYQESDITSVNDFENNENLVYPIPFNNEIRIKSKNIVDGFIPVEIFNSQGKMINRFNVFSSNGEILVNGLGELNSGVYYVRYFSEGKTFTNKIVK